MVLVLTYMAETLRPLSLGIPFPQLSQSKPASGDIPQAPNRHPGLSPQEFAQAIRNHLRYFPASLHPQLAQDFAEELRSRGHIWMERLRPTAYAMKAYPINEYPAKLVQCKALQLMIQNNLDPALAQFPHQMITYGGNGSVFSNWAQYHLVMKYLSEMSEDQTLVLSSGHPLGLFPSHKDAPRLVITNGMMIPNYSSLDYYEKLFAMGCTTCGQMTAGSFAFIGSQSTIHSTIITMLYAARKCLGTGDVQGKVLVTSGLGGMSGAQTKAGCMAGFICVSAEVSEAAIVKRQRQGWVTEVTRTVEETIQRIRAARTAREPASIAYLGNVVDLWEGLAAQEELLVDLGTDQTSLTNPFQGGYFPVQVAYEEAKRMLTAEPDQFKALVQESLRRHVTAINTLTRKGMKFWEYGNAFLLEASKAGAEIWKDDQHSEFRYPACLPDVMCDMFTVGFGPLRWVCTTANPSDLAITDSIVISVLQAAISDPATPSLIRDQYADNLKWIEAAGPNNLVTGSHARIIFSDAYGRMEVARRFNQAVGEGRITGPVVIARDHYDPSGTDSPHRETSNVLDGSMFTADMAVQNVIGDAFRGATWVSLHNGGGAGWGRAINGGYGMVLDGSADAERKALLMLEWDSVNGVARRSWSGNERAEEVIKRRMTLNEKLKVTVPEHVDPTLPIPTS